jgi:NAD(P)-dependent dehydrogenase (short-subunit alcohol dehydrogenase family)
MQNLKNKVALVSGSGRGIGRAIALKLARHGAKVVVNDADEEPGRAVAEEINSAGGEAVAVMAALPTKAFLIVSSAPRWRHSVGWTSSSITPAIPGTPRSKK